MSAKIATINPDDPDMGILREAASLLLRGEVIVCPTDTGYALAADALNEAALRRVFDIKGRSFKNPMHVAVSDIEEAEKYVYVSDAARILAQRFLPGALTMVLPRKETVPSLLTAGLPTLGIRIPDNQAILRLAGMTCRPITTTSANVSGRETPFTGQEAVEWLEEAIDLVSLVLDQGRLPGERVTSTLVDITVNPPRILRQGRIPEAEIMKALQSAQSAS